MLTISAESGASLNQSAYILLFEGPETSVFSEIYDVDGVGPALLVGTVNVEECTCKTCKELVVCAGWVGVVVISVSKRGSGGGG